MTNPLHPLLAITLTLTAATCIAQPNTLDPESLPRSSFAWNQAQRELGLGNGQLADGTQVLPATWTDESTSPSRGNAGYGYLWWLNPNGSYRAIGIFGQGIYINPQENIVIALHSARPDASKASDSALQDALYDALINVLKDD